ncbi:unnamed protein product, partial [Rotaria sp. Silwood1]
LFSFVSPLIMIGLALLMINSVDLETRESIQNDKKQSRQLRHDPAQRKGKMLAPHAKEFCEACQRGLCFV